MIFRKWLFRNCAAMQVTFLSLSLPCPVTPAKSHPPNYPLPLPHCSHPNPSPIIQRPGLARHCFSSIPSYRQAPAVVYGPESGAVELFNFTPLAQTETRERQKSIRMKDRRRMWMKAWIGKQAQGHSLFLERGKKGRKWRKSRKTAGNWEW